MWAQVGQRGWRAGVGTLLLLWLTSGSLAEESVGRPQVAMLFRALSFDANLPTRCPSGLQIGVVAASRDPQSMKEASAIVDILKQLDTKVTQGIPFRAELVGVENPVELGTGLSQKRWNTLFFSSGTQELLKSALAAAATEKVPLIGQNLEAVRAGAVLGLVEREGKSKLLINVDALATFGMTLDPRLMRLNIVEVVEKDSYFIPSDMFRALRLKGDEPRYPRQAQAAGVEGQVVVKVLVSAEGQIQRIQFVLNHPKFGPEVESSLRAWKLKPFLFNGRPVAIHTVMEFQFRLQNRK
jgi:TonB family protein